MSTISSPSSPSFTSPRQRILDRISNEVSLGTISSSDQTALDGAVDSIDSDLKSSGSSKSARLDPSALKSRVDGLIADQVSSGALTSDQAETLKQVFSQGHGGHGGHAGIGGPPPGPPPSDDGSSASDEPSTATSSVTDTSASTAGGASDLLASFLKQLQASQSQTSAYGSTGSSGGGRYASALLLNFEA